MVDFHNVHSLLNSPRKYRTRNNVLYTLYVAIKQLMYRISCTNGFIVLWVESPGHRLQLTLKETGFKYSQRVDMYMVVKQTVLYGYIDICNPSQLMHPAIVTEYRLVHTKTLGVIVSLYQCMILSLLQLAVKVQCLGISPSIDT